MKYLNVYKSRIEQFIDRIYEMRYANLAPLETSYTYDGDKPIPLEEIESRTFEKIAVGEKWGELWGSAWFRFKGNLGD